MHTHSTGPRASSSRSPTPLAPGVRRRVRPQLRRRAARAGPAASRARPSKRGELPAEEIWQRVARIEDARAHARRGRAATRPWNRRCARRSAPPGPMLAARPPWRCVPRSRRSRTWPSSWSRSSASATTWPAARPSCWRTPHLRTLAGEAHEALTEAARQVAFDADRTPELRLDCGQILFRLGDGAALREARELMQGFLDSSDRELRALGALALAQSGAISPGSSTTSSTAWPACPASAAGAPRPTSSAKRCASSSTASSSAAATTTRGPKPTVDRRPRPPTSRRSSS